MCQDNLFFIISLGLKPLFGPYPMNRLELCCEPLQMESTQGDDVSRKVTLVGLVLELSRLV